jgi:hypothetical protein
MPRSLRPLDPGAGPAQAFAAELRKLWEEAGRPTFLQMARKTGKSRTAMAEAVGGDHLPSWETIVAFVKACGGNSNEWRVRWEQARDARASVGQRGDAPDQAGNETPAQRPSSWARRLVPYAATVLVTAVIASTVTAFITLGRRPGTELAASKRSTHAAIITVQNKVAIGPDSLVEDTTPSYLSSKPVPYCSHYGCEIPGTQVNSSAMLVAVCYRYSTQMYNYNLDSSASQNNPYRARSRLWYKVAFPGRSQGYISEVYIVAADRGGMGLPRCR